MSDGLQSTEAQCAANAVAPRVSLLDIEASIAAKYFSSGLSAAGLSVIRQGSPEEHLGVLTVCFVVMRNGFVVVGKSAPASPENFSAELGRKLAYEDCVRQIWPLMGFALRDRLFQAA